MLYITSYIPNTQHTAGHRATVTKYREEAKEGGEAGLYNSPKQ